MMLTMSQPASFLELIQVAPGGGMAIVRPEAGIRVSCRQLRDQVIEMANALAAQTRATLVTTARAPHICLVVRSIMAEVEAVANKLGIELSISIDQRIAGAEKVVEHKTSMRQDLEAGRPMEPVVRAAVESGEKAGTAMPHKRTVYACARLLDSGTPLGRSQK
jgi:ketopantoate reductase